MFWQLQGFDSEEFIQQYWQKKPCLIRQAFTGFQSPVSPEELAGLACEESVHSRLVIEKGGETAWQLRYGPFTEDDFLTLPETHYSLLVSECEKWIPEFAELLDQFHFIPSWRIDDLMVSYAPAGGSVGPHIDEYDVFLLQTLGQRKWQYTNGRMDKPLLIPDLDLAIMQNFDPHQEAILEPGDMLYLPPGIAHHGVALGSGMTCSIGFRAPTASETLESFALEADRQNLGDERYSDTGLETDRHHAEITNNEVDTLKSMVISLLDQPRELWVDMAGKLLSDSIVTEAGLELSPARLEDLNDSEWMINPDSKMLYHRGSSGIRFYCNGGCYELPNSELAIDTVQKLCNRGIIANSTIEACRNQAGLTSLLFELINTAAIVRVDEK
ncbi:MAG: cupin domain-containing protein [Gammaproteobacteria bacterium]